MADKPQLRSAVKVIPVVSGPWPDPYKMLYAAIVCAAGFHASIWAMDRAFPDQQSCTFISWGCKIEGSLSLFVGGLALLFLVPAVAACIARRGFSWASAILPPVSMGVALFIGLFVLPGTSAAAFGLGVGAAVAMPAPTGLVVPIRMAFALVISIACMGAPAVALCDAMPFVVLLPDLVLSFAARHWKLELKW
jgi:hypothetical protein